MGGGEKRERCRRGGKRKDGKEERPMKKNEKKRKGHGRRRQRIGKGMAEVMVEKRKERWKEVGREGRRK